MLSFIASILTSAQTTHLTIKLQAMEEQETSSGVSFRVEVDTSLNRI